jgi:hypothetical protein
MTPIANVTREQKLLHAIDKSARGVEIGPSHSPVAPKRKGFRVTTIDTLSKQGLIDKYKNHGVELESIEDVDFIWRGERYPELLGERNSFGWVVASHVIEHTPDIVAFLNDCDELLTDTGVLSLAVPDKRYCFDHFRPVSGLARVLDSHFSRLTNHTAGSIAEYMLNAVSLGGQIAWSPSQVGEFKFLCELPSVLAHLKLEPEARLAMDIHAWCFTPASFQLLIHDLNLLGFTTLRSIQSFPTEGHEFFVTLRKGKDLPMHSRLKLLQDVAEESGSSQGLHRP